MPEQAPPPHVPSGPLFQGELQSGTARKRAEALAHLLAEHGVQTLTLDHAGQRRVLAARTTDLPGLLILVAEDLLRTAPTLTANDATFVIRPEYIQWQTHDVTLARDLESFA